MTTDRFQFYAGSRDAPPGRGTGERAAIPYPQLAAIPNWRQLLSNFAVTPFEWGGYRWRTVEHAFQAAKFRDVDPDLFVSFTMDSGSALGQADGLAARKMRKARILTKEQLADWDQRKGALMEELWAAKFSQSAEARDVLLATGSAELWHSAPRMAAERWVGLEELRDLVHT